MNLFKNTYEKIAKIRFFIYTLLLLIILEIGYSFHKDEETDNKINSLLDELKENIENTFSENVLAKKILTKLTQIVYR